MLANLLMSLYTNQQIPKLKIENVKTTHFLKLSCTNMEYTHLGNTSAT